MFRELDFLVLISFMGFLCVFLKMCISSGESQVLLLLLCSFLRQLCNQGFMVVSGI